MRCRDIATENTESLPENATLLDAAKLMAETGVGFLPVCDADRKVLGVLTDRDLVVQAMARGVDPATTPVTAVMTRPPITCFVDGDLGMAEDLMAEEQKSLAAPFPADLMWVEAFGSKSVLSLRAGESTFKAVVPPDDPIQRESRAWIGFPAREVHILDFGTGLFLR